MQAFDGLTVLENRTWKFVRSSDYNSNFNKVNGQFVRWGKTRADEDDPEYAPSPEIMDIELSTICHGITGRGPCKHCYKSNTGKGVNMSLETFKIVFEKITQSHILQQMAAGIGDIDGNPELFDILEYAREHGVIPNITINGDRLTDEAADHFARVLGAIAVSHYSDDICFNAVQKLTDRGMTQVNIHQMVSEETWDDCMHVIDAMQVDPRLANMNAVVFLSLKQKGRGTEFHPIDVTKYQELVRKCLDANIRFGFDSCSASKFMQSVQNHPQFHEFGEMADSCESLLGSIYVNVAGEVFPCSFTEGTEGWETGISLLDVTDFSSEVWYNLRVIAWREHLLETTKCDPNHCRTCPIYHV
jgi:MoaA/NifB/PqqE/SkfB family radical SAM enzyme